MAVAVPLPDDEAPETWGVFELASWVQPPPNWYLRAACRPGRLSTGGRAEEVDFFPARGRSGTAAVKAALAVCASCPVREDCLDHAVRHRLLGIWGGTSARERRFMRIGRAKPDDADRWQARDRAPTADRG